MIRKWLIEIDSWNWFMKLNWTYKEFNFQLYFLDLQLFEILLNKGFKTKSF